MRSFFFNKDASLIWFKTIAEQFSYIFETLKKKISLFFSWKSRIRKCQI